MMRSPRAIKTGEQDFALCSETGNIVKSPSDASVAVVRLGAYVIETMRICVACGGTGGHIFPGLATARELQARGHTVSLWLAGRDVEAASIDGWEGDVVSIRAAGFPSGFSLRSVGVTIGLLRAIFVARYRMARARPDVVLAMGSYASVGPVTAARSLGIPVVLHEANAVPGRAIALLSRMATAVGVTFEAAAEHLSGCKVSVTGMPLRGALKQVTHVHAESFRLLVMGGSQGAHVLNETFPNVAGALVGEGLSLRVTHLAGPREADVVAKHYEELGVDAEVHAFVGDMASVYAETDFAVARAGAATCAELAVCGVPALLVPLPTATRDHQMLNALAMASCGGVAMQPQQALTVQWCHDYLRNIIQDSGKVGAMRDRLLGAMPGDGAARLADLVEQVVSEKRG